MSDARPFGLSTSISLTVKTTLLAAALVPGTMALAQGSHGHGDDVGHAADVGTEAKTVEITMSDNFFEPEAISAAAGETVRLVFKNEGALVHSFSLGTAHMHEERQDGVAMMMSHGMLSVDAIDQEMMTMDMGSDHGMNHDSSEIVFVAPGETAELIWTFPEHGEIEFACNMPGHYDAGMMGEIDLGHGS